mmetsp:Transcript_74197/g.194603  ORF Transcript_74197/g.194603 Transcript_74197/m.194603 type:complete len:205 (+) Transcript_74197:160-774(+)
MDQQLRWLLQPQVFHAAAGLRVLHSRCDRWLHHPGALEPLHVFDKVLGPREPNLVLHLQRHHRHRVLHVDASALHTHELHQVPHEADRRELHDDREPGARGGREEQVRHRLAEELGAGLRLQRLALVAPHAHPGVPAHRRRRPVARALHARHRRGRGGLVEGEVRRMKGRQPVPEGPRRGGRAPPGRRGGRPPARRPAQHWRRS